MFIASAKVRHLTLNNKQKGKENHFASYISPFRHKEGVFVQKSGVSFGVNEENAYFCTRYGIS